MTIVNVPEKLLIMSIFRKNLKQKQCFVRKWQHFILFICFLGIDLKNRWSFFSDSSWNSFSNTKNRQTNPDVQWPGVQEMA